MKGFNLFLVLPLFLFVFTGSAQTDQGLVWSSYFGGSEIEFLNTVAATPNGGAVVGGFSSSTSGITTPFAHQSFYGGGDADGTLIKISEDKERQWATYFGGSGSEHIYDLNVLSDGSFVVVGSTGSATGIATEGAFMEDSPGVLVAFASRFSSDGEQIWGTYLGGTVIEFPTTYASSVVVDENDNIIVVGATSMPDFPITEGGHQQNFGGEQDGFIAKFDMDGDLLWSTFYGGDGVDHIHDVVVTTESDVVIYGYSESATDIASENAYQSEYAGQGDAFIARFSPTGERIWSTYYGGPSLELSGGSVVKGLTIGENDHIYIRMDSESAEGISTPGAHKETLEYYRSNVLSKFSPEGEFIWGTYFGNSALSPGGSITYMDDQIILSGVARYNEGYLMGNPYQTEINASSNNGDIYFAGFNNEGEQQWGTFYGGIGTDYARCIAPYQDHQFIMAGSTPSGTYLVGDDAFQSQHGGIIDGLIAIFDISNVTSTPEQRLKTFNVFPNPSSGAVRLQLPPEFIFRADIEIYNTSGQRVAHYSGFNSMEMLTLPETSGLYLIHARNGDRIAKAKVVVE